MRSLPNYDATQGHFYSPSQSVCHRAMIVRSALALLGILSVISASVDSERFPNSQEPLTIKGIITSIRYALSASPTYLAKQRWHFDPEVSKRRNQEYERIHGHHSVYLIERLGLGEDGREEERRQQQAIRDIGVPITGKKRR